MMHVENKKGKEITDIVNVTGIKGFNEVTEDGGCEEHRICGIRKVILLYCQAVGNDFIKLHSLDEILGLGYKVDVIDICGLIQPDADRLYSKSRMDDPRFAYHRITTWRDLTEYIQGNNMGCFYFVRAEIYYEFRKLYRVISKAGIFYGCGRMVPNPEAISIVPKVENITLKKLGIEELKKSVYNRLSRKFNHIKPSDILVHGFNSDLRGDRYLQPYGTSTVELYLSTFNYERFLRAEEYQCDREYFLFLDQYLPYHSDLYSEGYELDAKTYYGHINEIFAYIRSRLRLDIIIAPHPKADYSDKKYKYEDCQTIYGKTAELVKGAKLTATNFSVSLSFSVMANKPLLLFDSPVFDSIPFVRGVINKYSLELGCSYIKNAEDLKELVGAKGIEEIYSVDEKKYSEYVKQFYCCEQVDKPVLWEKILGKAEEIYAGRYAENRWARGYNND